MSPRWKGWRETFIPAFNLPMNLLRLDPPIPYGSDYSKLSDVRSADEVGRAELRPLRGAPGDGGVPGMFWDDFPGDEVLSALRQAG